MEIISTIAATCLAMNIYMEARNEPPEGQKAVAQVTVRRAALRGGPNHTCEAVTARYQFSWTLGGRGGRVLRFDPDAWRTAEAIARQSILWGYLSHYPDYSRGATHYHADYIEPPAWTEQMRVVARIGRHIFYTERSNDTATQVKHAKAMDTH